MDSAAPGWRGHRGSVFAARTAGGHRTGISSGGLKSASLGAKDKEQGDLPRRRGSSTAKRSPGTLSRHSLKRRTRHAGLSSTSAQGGASLLPAKEGILGIVWIRGGLRVGAKSMRESTSSESVDIGRVALGVLGLVIMLCQSWGVGTSGGSCNGGRTGCGLGYGLVAGCVRGKLWWRG